METKRRMKIGRVTGNKMDKTVVVLVETRRRQGLYRKVVTHRTKLKAHDATSACKVGDVVKIMESRPLSKTKHWRVVEVISPRGAPELTQGVKE